MADLRGLIAKKPGLTPRELTVEAQKIVRNGVAMYPHIGNSASSSISQLVKSGRAHYRLGPKGEGGHQNFIVYPDKGPRLVGSNSGTHHGSNKKKRKYTRRAVVASPAEAYPDFGKALKKALPNGHDKTAEVLLVLAVGNKDTITCTIGEGRAVYQQLRGIFEKA